MFSMSAADAFDAILYGEHNTSNIGFLQSQFEGAANILTDAGKAIFERAQQAYQYFSSNEALRFARDAIKEAGVTHHGIAIVPLVTLEEQQNASYVMQRWIMANPHLREKYLFKHRCEGYNGTYVDMSPGLSGHEHYDYRRVMDGLVTYDKDGGWKADIYFEQLAPGDVHLALDQQVDIYETTWKATDLMLAMGEGDPTSSCGGSL